MPTDRTGLSRRKFLRNAALGLGAATMASPLLAACGGDANSGGGVSAKQGLVDVLPDYVPLTGGVRPDIPSVTGANGASTQPGFLHYPTDLVKTVHHTPGSGGTYNAITPLWGTIPPPGNPYYQAVDRALGANLTMNPADGDTYSDTVPTLVAGNRLPDWIQLPGWWNTTLNVGELAQSRFADLTPYLSGGNIRKYPNLAAIPSGGWMVGAWGGRLYGIPSYASGGAPGDVLFYRKDIFDAKGINPDDVRSADDLYHLGAELTAPGANVWAFDQMWFIIQQMFNAPPGGGFYVDDGKLRSGLDSPATEAALAYAHRIARSGYMHPDALANHTSDEAQRFYSGNVLIEHGGTGGWSISDVQDGQAANPQYRRGGFKLFSADKSTPVTVQMGTSTSEVSYLSRSLSPQRIQECLRIADYLAAPFGSAEYTLINYGVEGVDWTRGAGGPTYTDTGQQEASQTTYQFLCAPQNVVSSPGYDYLTNDICAWEADAVRYTYKPVFWNMNVTPPNRFATISNEQAVNDIITQVTCGTKTVADFKAAVRDWKSNGGDQLVGWYQTNVLDKYGTGQ